MAMPTNEPGQLIPVRPQDVGKPPAWILRNYTPRLAKRLERDPSQPIGLPCPECGHRPALRQIGSMFVPGRWQNLVCGECRAEFTLADVLRYLWNRKS